MKSAKKKKNLQIPLVGWIFLARLGKMRLCARSGAGPELQAALSAPPVGRSRPTCRARSAPPRRLQRAPGGLVDAARMA